jgi:hypothetical protein
MKVFQFALIAAMITALIINCSDSMTEEELYSMAQEQ